MSAHAKHLVLRAHRIIDELSDEGHLDLVLNDENNPTRERIFDWTEESCQYRKNGGEKSLERQAEELRLTVRQATETDTWDVMVSRHAQERLADEADEFAKAVLEYFEREEEEDDYTDVLKACRAISGSIGPDPREEA